MNPAARWGNVRAARLFRLHGDERGTISVLTVVAVLGLMMLIGMVLNVGRHLDDKVQMQNAVDAAAYSGGSVLARGMNTLAFTNNLLCDVFALTAFQREAFQPQSDPFVQRLLSAWDQAAGGLEGSSYPILSRLGQAVRQQIPLERVAVQTFSEFARATAELQLPALEFVLRERLIPEFQRTVIESIPQLAQQATNDVTLRHGRKQAQRAQMGVLWRTQRPDTFEPDPVGASGEDDPLTRTMPAIDPTPPPNGGGSTGIADPTPDSREGRDARRLNVSDAELYLRRARSRRLERSLHYLDEWVRDRMKFFDFDRGADGPAKLAQYAKLFRSLACTRLMLLLNDEYPTSNLPHMIRLPEGDVLVDDAVFRQQWFQDSRDAVNQYLDRDFMFVGVAHRKQFKESSPGLFKNPLDSDPLTFAQVHLFIPEPRLWHPNRLPGGGESSSDPLGGTPFVPVPGTGPSTPPTWIPGRYWRHDYGWRREWGLFNQNWTLQLVPATTDSLAAILQTRPTGVGSSSASFDFRLPNLGSRGSDTSRMIRQLNTH